MWRVILLQLVAVSMLPICVQSLGQSESRYIDILKDILKRGRNHKLLQMSDIDVFQKQNGDSKRTCTGLQPVNMVLPSSDFDGLNVEGVNDEGCGLKGQSKKASLLNLLKKLGEDKNTGKATFKEMLQKIVGGQESKPNEWPFIASIEILTMVGFQQACGGSLISDQWILTAAHCFETDDKPSIIPEEINNCAVRVVLREHDSNDPFDNALNMDVVQIVIHADYNTTTNENDIALLKLAKKVDYAGQKEVATVCLPDANESIDIGETCTAIGWGLVKSDKKENDIFSPLREVQLTILSPVHCYLDESAHHQMCAGVLAGGKDTCQGDSGGPLLCDFDEEHYQFGVTSYGGPVCGAAGNGGVYTKVSAHMVWIETVLSRY